MKEEVRRKEDQHWDVIVIGAGLAGLTAATFLARSKVKVLLLEKGSKVGGRAITKDKAGGFLNLGPHALYRKGSSMSILHELGIQLQGGPPKLRGALTARGELYDMPLSPLSLLKSQAFLWKEKKEFVRLLLTIGKIDPSTIPSISLFEWANQSIHEEKVRNMFFLLCRLSSYSHDPELASASSLIKQLQLSTKGAFYVSYGWQTIVDRLKEKALLAGVTILEKHAVHQIIGVHPSMAVLLSDGNKVTAKNIISTASPIETYKMVEHTSSSSLQRMIQCSIPVTGSALDIVLKKIPSPKLGFAMDLEKPLYFSIHSNSARLTRNTAHAVIHIFKYASHTQPQQTDAIRKELEDFISLLQPNWRKELLAEQYLPTITVSNRLPMVGDESILSTKINEIPGLFVAGDWLTNHGLLADAAMSSAKQAATQIVQSTKEEIVFVNY